MQHIGLGGGCHWCTEAVFQSLQGVERVRQGFIASDPPDDAWSEAIDVTFDPDVIRLQDLIRVHLATHASTSDHSLRAKYRSAVYVFDAEQHAQSENALTRAAAESGASFVTRVLVHRGFKPSPERYHNYYDKDPARPFCRTYIDPKLSCLRSRFSQLMKQDK